MLTEPYHRPMNSIFEKQQNPKLEPLKKYVVILKFLNLKPLSKFKARWSSNIL